MIIGMESTILRGLTIVKTTNIAHMSAQTRVKLQLLVLAQQTVRRIKVEVMV